MASRGMPKSVAVFQGPAPQKGWRFSDVGYPACLAPLTPAVSMWHDVA